GIALGRIRDEGGEQGSLAEIDVRGRSLEVPLRRRANAVRAVAEIDGVEVLLEDRALRVLVLEGDREDRLFDLALQVPLRVAEHRVLHELLGDRRTTLQHGSRVEILRERATDASPVDAAVVVEVP